MIYDIKILLIDTIITLQKHPTEGREKPTKK